MTITVPSSGQALVIVTARITPSAANIAGFMSFTSTGGSGDVLAADTLAIGYRADENGGFSKAGATCFVTGLSPGSHTFTALYKTVTGSTIFENRSIIAIPMP